MSKSTGERYAAYSGFAVGMDPACFGGSFPGKVD